MTSVLIKRGNVGTGTAHRENPMCRVAIGCRKRGNYQKLGEKLERAFPRAF